MKLWMGVLMAGAMLVLVSVPGWGAARPRL